MPTEQKLYSKIVLEMENKMNRDVWSRNYLGQKGRKYEEKKEYYKKKTR